jgi:hypothetical protein
MNVPSRALVLAALLAVFAPAAEGQFLPEELAERPRWESYLRTAPLVGSLQMGGPEAVTNPWKLTLEGDGITRFGLWKNPKGRMRGYVESWETEIAAYRLDKLLGLNMIPPTVERRFRGERGSLQLWIESEMSLKSKIEEKVEIPEAFVRAWNRAAYLQRAFDNLIANEDRHARNVLIVRDWRMILIDHSRSFRTSRRFTEGLLFTEDDSGGGLPMRELSRTFVRNLESLTRDSIRESVGEYLSDDQMRAVLKRRDLILAEINRRIRLFGESAVLY